MSDVAIVAVNADRLQAVTSDGDVVPITVMLGADGEAVDDWEDCEAFVAGIEGRWFADLRENFATMPIQ